MIFAAPLFRRGGYFVDYVTIASPAGARMPQSGPDGVQMHASNADNLLVETLENVYPLRIDSLPAAAPGLTLARGLA